MNKLHLISFTLLTALTFSACTKTQNGSAPPNEGATTPSTQTSRPKLGGHGTSNAGGGGNGIDGRPIESYTKRIVDLPEYINYIAPVLKKMGREQDPDVLLAYLEWATTHKSWYFVPIALPQLPKERTSLAVESDQLALHSEREIFIDEIAYNKKSLRDRANLLMHEMVMAARMLMKKTPQEQCKELATTENSKCDDPVLQAFTDTATQTGSQTLGGEDHQAVRLLNEYLMTRNQDYTKVSTVHERKRLQFIFPWDMATSPLSTSDYILAIQRVMLAKQTFALAAPTLEKPATCVFSADGWESRLNVLLQYRLNGTDDSSEAPTLPNSTGHMERESFFNSRYFYLSEGSIDIHPVIFAPKGPLPEHPTSHDIYDVVSVQSPEFNDNIGRDIEFIFSRSSNPELIEVRVKSMRMAQTSSDSDGVIRVEAKDLPRVRCLPTETTRVN